MTKRFLVAAGLVAALAGGSVVSFAQGPGPVGPGIQGPGRGPRAVGPRVDLGLRGVELTDAQREQVRSIMQSHRSEFDTVSKALRDAHRAFGEATRAATVDEAAVRANSTTLANAMAEEAILRAKVRAEVHALLTPEQQQQLKEREANMQKRLQQRQERMKQRQQRPPQ
jgi:protein CpxP